MGHVPASEAMPNLRSRPGALFATLFAAYQNGESL